MWRLLLIRCPVDETVHSVKSELPRASASRDATRSPTGASPEGLGPPDWKGQPHVDGTGGGAQRRGSGRRKEDGADEGRVGVEARRRRERVGLGGQGLHFCG